MKIDVLCSCKKDRMGYMKKVSFTPIDGEIGSLVMECEYCGNRVTLEIDI